MEDANQSAGINKIIIPEDRYQRRIEAGWTHEEATTIPVGPIRKSPPKKEQDKQYRREEAIACVRLWEAALERYIEDACLTSVDSMDPSCDWDEDESYNDLYSDQSCLAQLLGPFDLDPHWMGELIKKRVEAFKDNHEQDAQERLFR